VVGRRGRGRRGKRKKRNGRGGRGGNKTLQVSSSACIFYPDKMVNEVIYYLKG